VIVDRELESYTQSLELTTPIVVFEEISQFKGEDETFDFGAPSEEEIARERVLPAFYLHTSGSTGHPKIIGQTHKVFCEWLDSNIHQNPAFVRRPVFPQSPLYHAYGTLVYIFGVTSGSAGLITHSKKPYTGESTLAESKKFKSYLQNLPLEEFGVYKDFILVTVPSILVDIATSGPSPMNDLAANTAAVMYGGAGLSEKVGDLLTGNGVNIIPGYGMTEIGMGCNISIPPKPRTQGEWRYIPFNEDYKFHWIETDQPERKQLVVLPGKISPAVFNYKNPDGFDTQDIWVEHPTMKGWYRHDGRAGDITVLSNGEKTNNKQLEFILLSNTRKISQVLVFGSGRPQNGLLISPARPIMGDKDFINEIWPVIEQMNNTVPAHSRVVKELVLVEDPRIPFALTDKGTVRGKITLNLYADQIERAYEGLEMKQHEEIALPSTFERADIFAFLQDVLHPLLPHAELTSEADLFEYGMDSLLAVRLRTYVVQLLQKARPSSPPPVPKNIVYDHPSISSLAQFILSSLSSSEPQSKEDDVKTRVRSSVERFTAGFVPRIVTSNSKDHNDGEEYVVVTGTTGSLGTFLLDQLLDRPSVKRVYCFNRKGNVDTTERQLSGFEDRGLNPAKLQRVLGDRVVLYDVDLSQPRLGLSQVDYEEVRTHVTHIIHSAWQLNFNLRMEGFERVHIAGVRHLIDLALSSPRSRSPRFVFLSTISTVGNYQGTGSVPEAPVEDETWATLGYGHSKLVSERISAAASKKSGLDATVVRIGQISGASGTGAWARSEYNPILFRSCFGLGMVPNDLPPIRWIPTDVAASVALKQTFTTDKAELLGYYHLENPVTTPWSAVANAISQYKGANLPQVPFQQWLSKVREYGVKDAEKVPAVRLLEFFESLENFPALDVSNTLKIAPEVEYGLVDSELIQRYLAYQGI